MTGRNKSLDANEKGCPDKSLHEFPWGAHVADPIPTQKPGMEGTGTYRPDVPGPTPGSLLYGYVSEARWQAIRTKEIYPFWVDLSKEQRMLWEREAKLICCAIAAKHMQPSVPAGWKLVPLIPTKDMIEASCKGPGMTMINNMLSAYQIRAGLIDEKAIKFRDDGKPAIQEAYEAMLAVAPEPKEKP